MTIKQLFTALPFVILGWVGILSAVSFLTDAAPAYVVLFPNQTVITRLDKDMSILAANTFSMTIASDAPRIAERLYRAGAWLVLPAGLSGCDPDPMHTASKEHTNRADADM